MKKNRKGKFKRPQFLTENKYMRSQDQENFLKKKKKEKNCLKIISWQFTTLNFACHFCFSKIKKKNIK